MKKWWRRFKNKHGMDFSKLKCPGKIMTRIKRSNLMFIFDPNGIYIYKCKYCAMRIKFPWNETHLAYHNMQRHIKAKHIDTL